MGWGKGVWGSDQELWAGVRVWGVWAGVRVWGARPGTVGWGKGVGWGWGKGVGGVGWGKGVWGSDQELWAVRVCGVWAGVRVCGAQTRNCGLG